MAGTVDIAGIDREKLLDTRFGKRFRSHAKTPEHAATCILEGVVRNRYLVYTSGDIRALYLLQRLAPYTYAAMMRKANKVFVNELERVGGSGPAQPAAR